MSSDILHAYGGCIIVKKTTETNVETHTLPVGIYAVNEEQAVGRIMWDAKQENEYPISKGWHSHVVKVVEFGTLTKEDK